MTKYILSVATICISLVAFSQDSTAFNRPDVPGEFVVDVGFNLWLKNTDSFKPKFWRSRSVATYYMNRKGLGNKFSLYYGLGLGMENYDMGDTLALIPSKNSYQLISLDDYGYQKINTNKLAVTYLEAPIEFRFHPMGTVLGEGFFIGLGAVAGGRISSHSKLKYELDDNKYIQKNKGRLGVKDYRYGGMFKVGFKGISAYYKHYFSPVFDNELEGEKRTAFSFGLSIMGF